MSFICYKIKSDMFICRISAVPGFPGLRWFPGGRDFNQWTGDDSKALMKVRLCWGAMQSLADIGEQVYLPAIAGHVPSDMVRCLAAFLDFCYLVRRNAICEDTISKAEEALERFHYYREVFVETGVVADAVSLPRQHSLKHYINSIRLLGSPNSLCSSITESKHIKAVKEPWHRSNHFNALAQMLHTNVRLDKLWAARGVFSRHGMLRGTTTVYMEAMMQGEAPQGPVVEEDDDDDTDGHGAIARPRVMSSICLAVKPGMHEVYFFKFRHLF